MTEAPHPPLRPDPDPGPDAARPDAGVDPLGGGDGRPSLALLSMVPNLVTLAGLCAGLTSISYVLQGAYDVAAALIVLAAVIDGMDGFMARKLNAQSSFGAELDSLSDFVCFGVAPGVFLYHFVLQGLPNLGWPLVLVYVLSACLRLARFNVARSAATTGASRNFVGVPAPAGAMLCLFPVYLTLAGWVDMRAFPTLVAVYVALVGLLMISRLPTPSLKTLRVPSHRAVWVFLGLTLFAGALAMRPWWVLAVCDMLYLGMVAVIAWRERFRVFAGSGDGA